MTVMAGEWSPALFLFGVGNEKSTGCILGKSYGHTIYWGLDGRYETLDIIFSVSLVSGGDFCYIFLNLKALPEVVISQPLISPLNI